MGVSPIVLRLAASAPEQDACTHDRLLEERYVASEAHTGHTVLEGLSGDSRVTPVKVLPDLKWRTARSAVF